MNNNLTYLQKNELKMPEYGRNVQQMVQHALTIEDRAERTRCARTIIDVMGNMFPYLRDVPDFKHKLWEHLYIMSDYKLDIDYPVEVTRHDERLQPEHLTRNTTEIKQRHYGRVLQALIEKAKSYPEGERREELMRLIANCMKRDFVTWNNDSADDTKIFDDLRRLSDGVIDIQSDTMKLNYAAKTNSGFRKNNFQNQKKGSKK